MMFIRSIISRLKEAIHIHKWRTLLIFPPHNQLCDKIQCKNSGSYGFLLNCEVCGETKTTKLPYGITEVFGVKNEGKQKDE